MDNDVMTIIYVHGLSSSGESDTVKTLRLLLSSTQVVAPDLPTNPCEALQLLIDLCDDVEPDLIIGTSMGAMFTQQLRGYKKILVNPAFHVSEFMRRNIGTQQFLNPRKDGATHYEITTELCDKYQELEEHQFENITTFDKKNTYALFGNKDTLVNCSEEYSLYYQNTQWFNGEHRLRLENVQDVIAPLIRRCEPRKSVFELMQIVLKGRYPNRETNEYSVGLYSSLETALAAMHSTIKQEKGTDEEIENMIHN